LTLDPLPGIVYAALQLGLDPRRAAMICERCGEVGETFMTEKYGELCEACQQLVEAEQKGNQSRQRKAFEQEG
jgi:hypothetical protein